MDVPDVKPGNILWLEQEYGYDRWDAYQLLTQAGGLYVGNMGNTTLLW